MYHEITQRICDVNKDIWGKYNPENIPSYSSLPHHICQVLAVATPLIDNYEFDIIFKNNKKFNKNIDMHLKNMCKFSVGCHDFGKTGEAFQKPYPGNKHYIDGYIFLEYALNNNILNIYNFPKHIFLQFISGAISHHKRKSCYGDIKQLSDEHIIAKHIIDRYETEKEIVFEHKFDVQGVSINEIIAVTNWKKDESACKYNHYIWNWLYEKYGTFFNNEEFIDFIQDLYDNAHPYFASLRNILQGITIISDCFGSDDKIFKYEKYGKRTEKEIRKRMNKSFLQSEKIVLKEITKKYKYNIKKNFTWNTLFSFEKNDMQTVFIAANPRNSLLESETGSGKTEACLYNILIQLVNNKIRKLVYTCPTNVLRNEITERIHAILSKIVNDKLNLENSLNIEEYINQDQDDGDNGDDDISEEISYKEKFENKNSRYIRWLSSKIIVTTYDQFLLQYNTNKNNNLRTSVFNNCHVIFDEAHMYDLQSLAWLEYFMKNNNGCSYTIISASLPSKIVKRFFEWVNKDISYPRILDVDNKKIINLQTKYKDKHFNINFIDSKTTIINKAKEMYDKGQKVLIFCNTVNFEQELAECVEKMNIPSDDIICMHSQYCKKDKDTVLEILKNRAGKDSPSKPCIILGNQAIQQGCNISCDCLITVPCRMTTFIQRLGRIKRFDKTPIINADVFIYDGDFDDKDYNKNIGSILDYIHHYRAMVSVLKKHTSISIPQQNRDLIDDSYEFFEKDVADKKSQQSKMNENVDKSVSISNVNSSCFNFYDIKVNNKIYSKNCNTVRESSDGINKVIELEDSLQINTYFGHNLKKIPITLYPPQNNPGKYNKVDKIYGKKLIDNGNFEYIIELEFKDEDNKTIRIQPNETKIYYKYGLK